MRRAFMNCVCAVLVLLLPRVSLAWDPNDFLAGTYTEPGTGLNLPYRLLEPAGYDPAQKYPLVLFLHGAGESGTDNLAQVNSNIDNLVTHLKMPEYGCFLLAPQTNSGWASYSQNPSNAMRMTLSVIDQVANEYNVDLSRIYVTGLSMGGYGTWETIWQYPSLYAAAVPICGWGDTTKASLMVNEPIWAFHCADDPGVPVSYTRNMIAAIQAAGGNPLYTEYPTGGHGGAWTMGYNTPELYSWMFSQATPEVSSTSWQRGPSTSGDWSIHANWTTHVPTSSLVASIDNGGFAVISTGIARASVLTVGESAGGYLWQTGGTAAFGSRFAIGLNAGSSGIYGIQGGSLNTTTLEVGVLGSGTLYLVTSAASVAVSDTLSFGPQGGLWAVPGSTIHVTGTRFTNSSTDPTALADLHNLILTFDGGPDQAATLEVAGKDFGATFAGLDNNFALGTLQIGSESDAGRAQLVDLIDNRPDWAGCEALYVENLTLAAGSYLDLNGLNLYYHYASIDPGSTIDYSHGGRLTAVPEPATVILLAAGVVGLLAACRRRRPR
jgi:predicted esterase